MTDQKSGRQVSRRRHSGEFKTEALGLAEQVGVSGAAKQLGLHESQLYAWRKKARYEASRSETEKALAIENARLKRKLAKQADAFAARKGLSVSVGLTLDLDELGHKYNRKTIAASLNMTTPARRVSSTPSRWIWSTVRASPNVRTCVGQYSSILKWTTTDPGVTAPTATSAPWPLSTKWSLNELSAGTG